MEAQIDTDQWSNHWRRAGIDVRTERILVTNFVGTEQELDFREPTNCGGLGRIRHFNRVTSQGWPSNPLPIDPACKALGLPHCDTLRAQVFQNAVCNWRCWYCFVPFNLLSANHRHSRWVTARELVNLYLDQPERPAVIDLTGGQPDLTPEWVPWMIREIQARGLQHQVYLWSDDNLSTDYFWRHLGIDDIELLRSAGNYGRVACFKGFDEESFAFNTLADRALFGRQFRLFRRFLDIGLDLYAYVTLTSPNPVGISDRVRRFVDRLQTVHEKLPLRTVPLEIQMFTPMHGRIKAEHRQAFRVQRMAVEAWRAEIERRFSAQERGRPITEVAMARSWK